ncbi:AAA family ATPase [Bacteroidales bacterium OttesenSCG-928-M11]|nr:AAA family ATPase [Bacteroidales bacterium OttesenSCG-928-M11]
MIENFFLEQVYKNLPFDPTDEQRIALTDINAFLFDRNPDSLFLLKGFAGTGKSSLVGAIVKTMNQLKQKSVLLAPTGRAAKVFSVYAGQNAYTIHKMIYRQRAFSNEPTGFVQADNLHKHTLFIVDEASMISNDGIDSFSFGSGRLLDDLIHYVYSGEGCRLILMGDSAQLPPVGQTNSPALDQNVLSGYGLVVSGCTLTQVVRQAKESGILYNATVIRQNLEEGNVDLFPKISIKNFPDLKIVTGEDLIDAIESVYNRDGLKEGIIITRSNKRANIFNAGVRSRILYREEELEAGDLLMIARNNYFWGKEEKSIDFIANGDLIEVLRVRKVQELYDFRFADISIRFPDYDIEMDVKILLDTLTTDTPALPKEMNDRLFFSVLEDYNDVAGKPAKMKKMKEDAFYNAVQVKYGYAITGHKAQGGQWKNVFLDLSYISEDHLGIDFYRWLYTAFTRATKTLYLINPPSDLLNN